jgi:hypothetical protein
LKACVLTLQFRRTAPIAVSEIGRDVSEPHVSLVTAVEPKIVSHAEHGAFGMAADVP